MKSNMERKYSKAYVKPFDVLKIVKNVNNEYIYYNQKNILKNKVNKQILFRRINNDIYFTFICIYYRSIVFSYTYFSCRVVCIVINIPQNIL